MFNLLIYTIRGRTFGLIIFAIAAIALGVVFWLTGGAAFGYRSSKLSENARSAILSVHLLGSIILALAIPNNYLNEIPFFDSLYTKSELWIPVTMFVLLIAFVTLFGGILSLLFPAIQGKNDVDKPKDSID